MSAAEDTQTQVALQSQPMLRLQSCDNLNSDPEAVARRLMHSKAELFSAAKLAIGYTAIENQYIYSFEEWYLGIE